ncbi:uncharacterized protein [Chironomus tepperi]|uniref:uncharacterized protein n=1 Tax=Chironomus tepperi TaxID=113505 RepID=UPI00391F77AC
MKSLYFPKTGKKHELNCDIMMFSDRIRSMPDRFDLIVLSEIQNKHCAIIKDDEIYKIIDFCSFDTKLFTKQDIRPKLLKPLTFYELRDSDVIFIGEHEIVFRSEHDKTEKPSFYIPETQEIEQDFQIQDTIIDDDIELPETQAISEEIGMDTQMRTSFLEPESAKILKEAVERGRNEYLVETQPIQYVHPPNTRRYAAKQNELKPKTVPLSVFDCDTQALNAETQPISYSQLIKNENPKNLIRKRKSSSHKDTKKGIKNSVLLSDTESDSDDDRSRISAVSVKYADQSRLTENSISQISINDDYYMGGIQSPEFDSQFLEEVNASCNMENTSDSVNADKPIVKEEVKKESKSDLVKRESEDDIVPGPRKRVKLFKYISSDED